MCVIIIIIMSMIIINVIISSRMTIISSSLIPWRLHVLRDWEREGRRGGGDGEKGG